jgi:hypothetical protein
MTTTQIMISVKDFESEYRDAMDETLNQLQTATLLLAQVEHQIAQIGSCVQSLSQRVEEFIIQQKSD